MEIRLTKLPAMCRDPGSYRKTKRNLIPKGEAQGHGRPRDKLALLQIPIQDTTVSTT